MTSWAALGRERAMLELARDCWRERGFGDFWSYMLLAEGAVDIAAEPELALYDMAALVPIVTEAGGRFTSLDGGDGPFGGNAVATNGLLHEAVLARIGDAAHGLSAPPSDARAPCSEQPEPVGLGEHPLEAKQGGLAVQATGIPGQRPIGTDDPVTGQDDRDGVGAVGRPHRPRGTGGIPRAAAMAPYVVVVPHGIVARCSQHPTLEVGPLRAQWQVEDAQRAGEVCRELTAASSRTARVLA